MENTRTLDVPLFSIGQLVEKYTGDYKIKGIIRGIFTLYEGGPIRYVVRHEAEGGGFFCHIYSPNNIRAL